MSNLVTPVRSVTTKALIADLREAHDFLVSAARELAPELAVPQTERWGIKAKRTKIGLSRPRPTLLQQADDDHSFAEVMNQCATLERLLDALEWLSHEADFDGWTVEVCHPTTSSHKPKGGPRENDIVLVSPNGKQARFEVSDVASDKDGNRKLPSELASLGVESGTKDPPPPWPDSRVFVVVSEKFAAYVARRDTERYRFNRMANQVEDTVIFEVLANGHPTT